jgi:hypothetical protein
MKQIGLLDGLDVYLLFNPVRTFFSDTLLMEFVGKVQADSVDDEGFLLRLAGVESVDERRFTKEKIKVLNAVEAVFKSVVGVDRKIRGNYRESRAIVDLPPQKVRDGPAFVVVAES